MTTRIYMSTEDVAAQVGMSSEWVRRQCKAKNLVATKLGRSYRIEKADFETFMRKYRGGEAPAARTRTRGAKRRVA
jgi:excisionase family DNA binding protein